MPKWSFKIIFLLEFSLSFALEKQWSQNTIFQKLADIDVFEIII